MSISPNSSKENKYSFEEISLAQIDLIEPLWQKLNSLHTRRSIFFKEHFSSFSFTDRMQLLESKDDIKIFCAVTDKKRVGYCLCSLKDDVGEIDSLYIDEKLRISGLGSRLVKKALHWFKDNGASQLTVSIAHGNEDVIPFYENFGFEPRYLVMTADLD